MISVIGQLRGASNATLLVEMDGDRYVYKPIRGERELWDFPTGTLAARERAMYVLNTLLGWSCIPETLLIDGPHGVGSAQRWVDGEVAAVDVFDPDTVPDEWLSIFQGQDAQGKPLVLAHRDDSALARLAVLDALANNADRKAGHILTSDLGHHVGIDHGVTFHHEPKLRTVLWGWIDQPIDNADLDDVNRARDLISRSELTQLLSPIEIDALVQRFDTLMERRTFPRPSEEWPSIPWPVF